MLNRRQSDLTLLMENVHKPHNLAAILRTCDAVGIGTVYATTETDEYTMRLKAASGANQWVDLKYFKDITTLLSHIKESGFTIYGTQLSANALDFRHVDFTEPSAILMGQELHGISPKAAELVDKTIHIPMVGMGDSLNVSVAAATILFEAQRQRESAGKYSEMQLDQSTYEKLLFELSYPEASHRLKKTKAPYPPLSEDGDILKH